jgi:hypothetical protein
LAVLFGASILGGAWWLIGHDYRKDHPSADSVITKHNPTPAPTVWQERKASPVMPTKITLTDGEVLRKVRAVTWTDDCVLLRYIGGVGLIRYKDIADPKPDVVQAIKASAMALARSSQSKLARMQSRVISGRVSATTAGAGVYKFWGVTVKAYPADVFNQALDAMIGHLTLGYVWSKNLEHTQAWINALKDYRPVASSETDADGKYVLSIPPQTSVFLVCYTDRQVGYNREFDLWVIKPGETDHLDLNSSNQWVQR